MDNLNQEKPSTNEASSATHPYLLIFLRVLIVLLVVCAVIGWIIAANPVRGDESKSSATPSIVKPPVNYTPAPETADSKKGQELFKEHNCAVCHSLGSAGGCLGPPLIGVGSRRSKDFLLARISAADKEEEKFAKIYGPELMRHPRLAENSAQQVVAYLLTLPEPASGFKIGRHQSQSTEGQTIVSSPNTSNDPKSVAAGKKLFYVHGCASCHAIGGIGGQFAPALDGVSKRKDAASIEAQITGAELLALPNDSEYSERGTVMPPANLSKEEVQKISAFLLSIPERQ